MREYNDYIRTTRRWMKDYNTFKATIAGMNTDIEAQQRLLDKAEELAAPIAQYNGMPKGGGTGLNAVEAAAQDRIRRAEAIRKKILNRDELQRLINMIDNAIAVLPQEEQEILKEHYFKRVSWERIGSRRKYSERWARDKGGKALKKLAFAIHGTKAQPEQLTFVFLQ